MSLDRGHDAFPDLRWKFLVAAVERLAGAERIEDVIEIVRSSARSISGADGVTFVLREGDRCYYVDEDAVGPLWKGQRFPLEACISGWCMIHAEQAIIGDIYEDPRIPHDAYRPTFVRSLLMTPVGTVRPIAAIGAYWADKRSISGSEIALMEALARTAGAALDAAQTRMALREAEQRTRLALNSGGLLAWSIDLLAGTIAYSADETAHSGPTLLTDFIEEIHIGDRARYREALDRAAAEGTAFFLELRVHDSSGEQHWLEINGKPFRDANGRVMRIAGVSRDVSEAVKNRARLERLQNTISKIGRLNELGQMAANIAHELNQPLTALTNYIQVAKALLSESDSSGEPVAEVVDKALKSCDRLHSLIRQTRETLRSNDFERRLECIPDIVGEVVELVQTEPKCREVSISQSIPNGLPKIAIDRIKIQQVMINLLRNAAEAMEGSAQRKVDIAIRPIEDGFVEFEFSDTGPGIAAEIADELFQSFVTSKEYGTGLGLALCRSIVESHGGKIWATSAPEGGASFHFTLPAKASRNSSLKMAVPSENPVRTYS